MSSTEEDAPRIANTDKKARVFNLDEIMAQAIAGQRERVGQSDGDVEASIGDKKGEKDVTQRFEGLRLPGEGGRAGDAVQSGTDAAGRGATAAAATSSAAAVSQKEEEDDDDGFGPALPPGFVPDKSVQVDVVVDKSADSAGETGKKKVAPAEDNSDDEDVTVATFIPATYEAKIVHGLKPVYTIAFDVQGSKFATGGQNYAVQLFDFQKMDSSMKPFREVFPSESHVINSLAFSQNGETLVVAAGEAQMRLLDRIGKQWCETVRGDQYLIDLANTKGHTAAVNRVVWHPFSKTEFMSCSDDGSLRLWSTDDFKKITKCINTQRKVIKTKNAGGRRTIPTACCYSLDAKLIAAGCDDGSIQVWRNGNHISVPKYLNRNAHKAPVCWVEFSPDGKQVLSRGMDDTLKLFNLSSFKEPVAEAKDLSAMYIHTACGYSPHGEFVFTTTSSRPTKDTESGSLLFFHSTTLELAYRIEYPDVGAVSCVWHPKLDQILVGFTDGTCKIYYDPRTSARGALMCATKPVKRSRVNEVVKEDMIIAPLALDMFQPRGEEDEEKELTEWRIKKVLRMQSGRQRPQFKKPGEMPMVGHSAGGRLAKSGGSLHSYIAQQLGKSQNKTFIQDEDVRASILRHAEDAEAEPLYVAKAYKRTQPTPIFQEDPEEDEGEPEYKVSKLNK